jgi:hypothetical protein
MTRIAKRLAAAERVNEETRQRHLIWADYGDTQADLNAKRNRMIAEGTAHPDDEFVFIGWLEPEVETPKFRCQRPRAFDRLMT